MCCFSSYIAEGWDANNVTPILGVRAFSTQLLCEQVIGRALRRIIIVLIQIVKNLILNVQILGYFDFTSQAVQAPIKS